MFDYGKDIPLENVPNEVPKQVDDLVESEPAMHRFTYGMDIPLEALSKQQ